MQPLLGGGVVGGCVVGGGVVGGGVVGGGWEPASETVTFDEPEDWYPSVAMIW